MEFTILILDLENQKNWRLCHLKSPYVFSLTDSRNCDAVMEISVVQESDEMEAFVAIFNQGFESIKNEHHRDK